MFSIPCTKDIGSVCVSSSINMCVCHKICCRQHRPSKAKYQQQCKFTNNAHLKFSLIAIYFCEDMDFTDYPQSVQSAGYDYRRDIFHLFLDTVLILFHYRAYWRLPVEMLQVRMAPHLER